MIRKWSYLSINVPRFPTRTHEAQSGVIPRHAFKVFRTTTRFKKFRTDITLFVRRKHAKRRHKTNWLEMGYITKDWMFFINRNRQFVRFTQALGIVNFNSYSASTRLFVYNMVHKPEEVSAGITACTRNILNHFTWSRSLTLSFLFTENALLSTTSLENLEQLTDFNSGLVLYDGLTYPYNIIEVFKTTETRQYYKDLYDTLDKSNYVTLRTLYRILTLVSLVHVKSTTRDL